MNKRGQIAGQPFIYIFIIFVAVLVIIFGIKIVIDLIGFSEYVETSILVDKIQSEVDSCFDLDIGSTCFFDKSVVNNNIKELCFINIDEDVNLNVIDDEVTKVMINNSVYYNEGYNLFLVPNRGKKLEERRYKIENVKMDENPLCEDLNDGKVNILLYNDGSLVKLRRV